MSTLHEGFSSSTFDPVAAPFRGFRAFLIDDLEKFRPLANGPRPTIPADVLRSGGDSKGGAFRGTLRGIFMQEYVWGPDVNTAFCMTRLPFVGSTRHDQPVASCDCGFWAYTNGDHFLSVSGPAALGVVEAWGRMVIGPHGFRAEKARIVALCFPKYEPVEEGDDTQVANTVGPQANVRFTSWEMLAAAVRAFGLSAAGFLRNAAALMGGMPPPTPPVTPERPAAKVNRAARPWERVDEDLKAAVRRLYPDVPIYESVDAMQKAYPLTDTTPMLAEPEASNG